MKTWRLVSGILSIVIAVITSMTACTAGAFLDAGNVAFGNFSMGNILFGNLVAVLMLAGGIVSICTREGSKKGDTTAVVLYGAATVFGFIFAPSVWLYAVWTLACAIIAIVALVKEI